MNIHQAIYQLVLSLNRKIDAMALNTERLVAAVTASETVISSVEVLLGTLVQEIRDLKASNDPALQAQIDDLANRVELKTAELAKAAADSAPV